MGGGGRVLTQLEQNAMYLEEYTQFTKMFKHLDLVKGEVEFNDSSALNLVSVLLSIKFGDFKFLNNDKILLNIEKMLISTMETKEIMTYFKGNHRRFRLLRNPNSEGFLGEELWNRFEKFIANDTRLSLEYALLIGGRFELGEKSISKDAYCSLEYVSLLGCRFELGEKSISEKNEYLLKYAKIIGP